jgi:hypothetical protein
MPLLYGEKEKAFLRLQEAILRTTTDQSILVWKDPAIPPENYTGLMACSPKYFAESENISSWGIWGKTVNSLTPTRDWTPISSLSRISNTKEFFVRHWIVEWPVQ